MSVDVLDRFCDSSQCAVCFACFFVSTLFTCFHLTIPFVLDSMVMTSVHVCVRVGVQTVSKEQLAKDPHAPKPNKTPFNFFSVDARQKAKESYPQLTQTEATKKVNHHSSLATSDDQRDCNRNC